MFTEDENLEKICSFYASDYHLEMIMIPYINKKINEQVNVEIITEKDLKETARRVISNINLPKERKEELLNIDWKNKKIEDIKQSKINKESIYFVVGNTNYIDSVDKKIENMKLNTKTKIINCFNLEDIQKNMTEIVSKHSKVLNTTEEKEIK